MLAQHPCTSLLSGQCSEVQRLCPVVLEPLDFPLGSRMGWELLSFAACGWAQRGHKWTCHPQALVSQLPEKQVTQQSSLYEVSLRQPQEPQDAGPLRTRLKVIYGMKTAQSELQFH